MGRRRIAMSQRRARKAQRLGPLAGAHAAAAEAPTLEPAHAAAEAPPAAAEDAGAPASAAQGSAGSVGGDNEAAGPGHAGVVTDGVAGGKQVRKRRGSRRADSGETRRSQFHGVTWSRKVGKWRAQARQA